MKLHLDPSILTHPNQIKIHILPCKIDMTGPAPVEQYFLVDSLIARGGDDNKADPSMQVSTFRGRKLLGVREEIPKNTIGLSVMQDVEFNEDDDEEDGENNCQRVLRVDGTFDSITYWQHDCLPKSDNKVAQWMKHLEMMRVLHGE